tara:strand:- start:295 stop:594 length:300 start_codon:yes stop_codon:yes gene_type:complete
MKKLLGIAVLGMFWCNLSFAEEIEYSASDLIKLGYVLTHVTQTSNQFVLMYTFEKELRPGKNYLGATSIVTCHIALDKKKNRGSCYSVADWDKANVGTN